MEEYTSTKKSKKEEINMENQNVNEDLFGLKDKDYERLITINTSHGGSNRGRGS